MEIPGELYDDFKSEIAKLGITMKDVMIELIKKWLKASKEAIDEKQSDARH